MSRIIKSLLAIGAVGMATGGVAAAASTPTITAESVVNVNNTTATLTATINPNGTSTGYVFQYGPSSAYGFSTNSRTIHAGTKPVQVQVVIAGLTPGSLYHFHVAALSGAGLAAGTDKTFKTTGPPPATVTTGPAVNVGKTIATVTASIDPQGAPTSFAVQYGPTANYGQQTIPPQNLAAVTSSQPVSLLLSGLAPATLFHYRFVAYHNGNIISSGTDATFFTEPSVRPKPRLAVRTSPRRSRKRPFTYATSGRLRGANSIPTSAQCSGSVTLKYFLGRKRIGILAAPIGPDCTFSAQNSFRRVHAALPARITIKVHFNGNGYIAPVDRTNTVTAG